MNKLLKSLSTVALAGLILQTQACTKTLTLEQQIAQKLMIDLRYYCQDQVDSDKRCTKPMLNLTDELKTMISETGIGGVILFADNLNNVEQIVTLNHDLQEAANQSALKSPLLISIDQEGGRVARLPRESSTPFTGNMSIGATYPAFGDKFATESATVIAKELTSLGFNLNFAPNIDVNVNPDNPVINVRSFSENPEVVSKLGLAQVKAFEKHNLISTIKHFPGHGDTSVDSHTGLPLVNHDIETINKVDLLPFKQIIEQASPGMVMTAHIQYPALDSTTFVSKSGETMIKPATMSRKILTDILRKEMGFDGVIITDALDMKGISDFFTPTQAVINTFEAGVDIALMPIYVRSPQDIPKLKQLIDDVAKAIKSGELNGQEIAASADRILAIKDKFKLASALTVSKEEQLALANKTLASDANKQAERALAENAITMTQNKNDLLPLASDKSHKLHLLMPDQTKCDVFAHFLSSAKQNSITCTNLLDIDETQAAENIRNADVVIGANISPKQSAVELGGMDDLVRLRNHKSTTQTAEQLEKWLRFAKESDTRSIFVSLRAPYDIATFASLADTTLATYAYNAEINEQSSEVISPAFDALTKAILGKVEIKGQLPVTIAPTEEKVVQLHD